LAVLSSVMVKARKWGKEKGRKERKEQRCRKQERSEQLQQSDQSKIAADTILHYNSYSSIKESKETFWFVKDSKETEREKKQS